MKVIAMNRNQFICSLVTFFFLNTALFAADEKDKEVKIKTSAVCEMCKSRIEKNLAFEKGVKEATLDVETKIVTIRYNPAKTDVDKLKANITKTGYDADDVTADPKGYAKLPSCCKKGGMDHH